MKTYFLHKIRKLQGFIFLISKTAVRSVTEDCKKSSTDEAIWHSCEWQSSCFKRNDIKCSNIYNLLKVLCILPAQWKVDNFNFFTFKQFKEFCWKKIIIILSTFPIYIALLFRWTLLTLTFQYNSSCWMWILLCIHCSSSARRRTMKLL